MAALRLKISKEEKMIQFVYLLIFWVIMGTLFCYVCFFNYSLPELRTKYLVLERINQQKNILDEQQKYLIHLDSLNRMLQQYNPSTKQVSFESNINYELDELRRIYDRKKSDPGYKIINQLTFFYSMEFFDKKASWNSTNNSSFLKKNLEDCEIGFQKIQDNLNIKNALSGGVKNK